MRKYILVLTVFLLTLASCQRKEDVRRLKFEEYKNSEYSFLEPLMAIWWTEPNNSKVGYPYKKFCETGELRILMEEINEFQLNKKPRSKMDIPAQGSGNVLRIYFSNRMQTKFCVVEIEFAINSVSREFVSEYGRSARLYELLSSKEESPNFWGTRHPEIIDSNEYKEHWRKMMETLKSRDSNLSDQNRSSK